LFEVWRPGHWDWTAFFFKAEAMAQEACAWQYDGKWMGQPINPRSEGQTRLNCKAKMSDKAARMPETPKHPTT